MDSLTQLAERLNTTVPILIGLPIVVLIVVWFVVSMVSSGKKSRTAAGEAQRKQPRKQPTAQRAAAGEGVASGARDRGQVEKQLGKLVQSERFAEAAPLALELGKKDVAAGLLERAGKYAEAAELLEQIRQFEPAAKLYLRAAAYPQAAALYERLGRFEDAAECYVKDGDFRAAAELYVKKRDYAAAAAEYAKVTDKIVGDLSGDDISDKRRKFLLKVAVDAGKVFEHVGDAATATRLYQAAGQADAVARLATKAGRVDQGAEALVTAGRVDEAISLLDQAGETRRANELRAKRAEDAGDYAEAAELYAGLERHETAAELFAMVGQADRAAEMMERLGQYADAGNYYLKAKNGQRAAESFEKAGLYEKAAALYQRLGKDGLAVEMLVRGGQIYEAGLSLAKAGQLDRALEVLAGMAADDDNADRTKLLRADILLRQERFPEARALYAEALSGADVHTTNLENFYRYGVLLQNAGESAMATEIYEKILRHDKQFRDVAKRYRSLTQQEATGSQVAVKTESANKKRRYVILDELGRGGMGVVYKAMDRTLDRVVAFKVLPADVKSNKALVDNFFREAKAAAALNHPNIVTVFDAGEEDDVYYIAMEYIEGRTLKQIVKESGPFPVPHWILVFGQVCRALEYAHNQKIVHRDIKPSNLMWLERDKAVKITDFGLAKVIQEVSNFQTVVGGTPHYMSPEQILGGEVDRRADIYSLGAAMYELATGSVPYPKGDAGYHHIHSPVPDARDLRPDFPETLAGILMKCMDKEPDGRYRTANEILAALQEARNQA